MKAAEQFNGAGYSGGPLESLVDQEEVETVARMDNVAPEAPDSVFVPEAARASYPALMWTI
jgi:hypothetical protein